MVNAGSYLLLLKCSNISLSVINPQCDRKAGLFFNLFPFMSMKICQMASKNCHNNRFKSLPNTVNQVTQEKLPETIMKILSKWCDISPNLVTLVIRHRLTTFRRSLATRHAVDKL